MKIIHKKTSVGLSLITVDRIGTHRHSTRIGAEFDQIDTAKQGQKYGFTVLILGKLQLAKQANDVGAPQVQVPKGNGKCCSRSHSGRPYCFMIARQQIQNACRATRAHAAVQTSPRL